MHWNSRLRVGILFLCVVFGRLAESSTETDCNARQISENKMVCVCSKTECDQIKVELPEESGQAIQVESSRSGKRFRVSKLESGESRKLGGAPQSTIYIKLGERHQTIMGWGGAFTDAAALNAYNLSKPMTVKLIESYYGADGLLYNFGRVPMGGSDFSTRAYTYDDVADDYDLRHWSLAPEDTQFKIPMLKEASRLCMERGEQLKLFASPWSPPVWMKTSNNIVKGHLKDEDRIYRSYANYLIEFYRAYKEHGVEFWGQTLENEPVEASRPEDFINSLEFNSSQQIKFVTEYFGPALEANGMGKQRFKLMVGDDSLSKLLPLVPDVLNDAGAGKYFAGLAYHWYDSNNGATYDDLNRAYNKVADKIEFLIMTEACSGNNFLSKKVDLGNWDRADAYAMDIIEDLQRNTNAWIDWNLALNRAGGPNWAKNFIDSPIIVDETNDEFLKQPMYYALAHFSRFFRPGSVRVGTHIDDDRRYDIRTVAVRDNSTGHLIVNLLNRSFRDLQVELSVEGGESHAAPMLVDLEPRSIKTVIVKL